MFITKSTFSLVLTALVTLSFTACGSDAKRSAGGGASTNPSFRLNGSLNLDQERNRISGTGEAVAESRLSSVTDGRNFVFEVTLPSQSSTVQFVAFSQDGTLNSGMNFRIERSGAGAVGHLGPVAFPIGSLDGDSIRISIDVHNGESPAHVLVWTDASADPVLNTEDIGSTAHGQGGGRSFGFALNDASVRFISAGAPREEHE